MNGYDILNESNHTSMSLSPDWMTKSLGLSSMRGYALHWAMAHILTSLSILKYPLTPHEAPQEFLIFQYLTPF